MTIYLPAADPIERIKDGITTFRREFATAMMQLFVGGVILFLAYLVIFLSQIDYQGGIQIFEILFLVIAVPVTTTLVAFVAGLPLRFMRRARQWWIDHSVLALIGVVLGIALVATAYVLGERVSGVDPTTGAGFSQFVANGWLLIAGWLIGAFSLLHVRVPISWRRQRVTVMSAR